VKPEVQVERPNAITAWLYQSALKITSSGALLLSIQHRLIARLDAKFNEVATRQLQQSHHFLVQEIDPR
jgi:hypothetical protein